MVPAPTHDGPARSDGAEGTGQVSGFRGARPVTVARPPVVAPPTGSWEGTAAGNAHTTRSPP